MLILALVISVLAVVVVFTWCKSDTSVVTEWTYVTVLGVRITEQDYHPPSPLACPETILL